MSKNKEYVVAIFNQHDSTNTIYYKTATCEIEAMKAAIMAATPTDYEDDMAAYLFTISNRISIDEFQQLMHEDFVIAVRSKDY